MKYLILEDLTANVLKFSVFIRIHSEITIYISVVCLITWSRKMQVGHFFTVKISIFNEFISTYLRMRFFQHLESVCPPPIKLLNIFECKLNQRVDIFLIFNRDLCFNKDQLKRKTTKIFISSFYFRRFVPWINHVYIFKNIIDYNSN